MSKPAPTKTPPEKTVAREIKGILPSRDAWVEITIYTDNSIRIVRNWCEIDRKQAWPDVEEKDWTEHRHLCGLLEPRKQQEITYTHPLDRKK